MSAESSDAPDRRAVLRKLAGLAGAPAALAAVSTMMDPANMSLIATAHAAIDVPGVAAERGDVVHIPGASAPTSMIAEWYDTKRKPGQGFSIAASKGAYEKAPASASRYEAKLYVFPSGNLRRLTFTKGAPAYHLITFETVIYVVSGTATLTPLENHPGKPLTVRAGDALFLPSGVLSNPKPSEDLVLLQGFVERNVRNAKKSIVSAKQAVAKDATRTYTFDGNAMRVITLKGNAGTVATNGGADALVYVAKGKARRAGVEVVAGDCVREIAGNAATWDASEETILVAIDARLNPAMTPPDQNV